jgi:uncharacterized protein with GYD domain
MLFIYIHTHPVEKCLADKPQETAKIMSSIREEANKAGVKLIGTYVAAHEHTIYAICEADDTLKLELVLRPMTLWGNARLIPIVSAEQMAVVVQ